MEPQRAIDYYNSLKDATTYTLIKVKKAMRKGQRFYVMPPSIHGLYLGRDYVVEVSEYERKDRPVYLDEGNVLHDLIQDHDGYKLAKVTFSSKFWFDFANYHGLKLEVKVDGDGISGYGAKDRVWFVKPYTIKLVLTWG